MKTAVAVFAAVVASFAMASPLAATPSEDITQEDTAESEPTEDSDSCDEANELEACSDPDTDPDSSDDDASVSPEFVEQLPPAELLKKLPEMRPSWMPDSSPHARSVPGTDVHSCGSFYISQVGYTHNYRGTGYVRFHVDVTWQYEYIFAGTPLYDAWAWNALENCIQTHGPTFFVRDWDAIEDQFLCHAFGSPNPLAGSEWDLEGFREATNNPYTWLTQLCNW